MSDAKRDPLDAALARLPRDVQPSRDLWPAIEAELKQRPERQARSEGRAWSTGWMQLAAGVLILVATAVTTHVITRKTMEEEATGQIVMTPAQPLEVLPAGYAGYSTARKQLEARYRERIAALPPVTRARLERDLEDLRRAANDIATTLAAHPSDPLLQELLMSTYQSELDLLSGVGDMATATPVRTDL